MMDFKEDNCPAGNYAPDQTFGRQSVSNVLAGMIAALKQRLAGFEAMKKMADRLEPGSPLEETLWEALMAWQRDSRRNG